MDRARPCRRNRPRRRLVVPAGALDELRFIRDTMERSASFTAVSGAALVVVGATALLAAWLASLQPTTARWLVVWLAEASLAVIVSTAGILQKARRSGTPLFSGPARKMLLGLAPPLLAGALLTPFLFDNTGLLAAMWLLVYGAAVITGGSASIRTLPLMGGFLMALGALALFVQGAPNAVMACGFGLVHIAFGIYIARQHGG